MRAGSHSNKPVFPNIGLQIHQNLIHTLDQKKIVKTMIFCKADSRKVKTQESNMLIWLIPIVRYTKKQIIA